MEVRKITEFKKGWFIGNFDDSVLRTEGFEIAYATRTKGQPEPRHYHKVAKEITVIIEGKIKIHDVILQAGDVFVLDPWEITDPEILEDTKLIIVKTPSVIGDKYIV